ncbi:hypothetical protein HanIR_Chr04g0163461 [Helianthus annuus]|nr:hypothetical protein HanIR_Chr04g0163461 [Helianthus annuus]
MGRFIANLMNNHEIASSFFFFGLKLQSISALPVLSKKGVC